MVHAREIIVIRFIDNAAFVAIPLQEWIAHCRGYGYNPVPQEIREIQEAIERRAWTKVLGPIMQELNLLPDVADYDYLSVDDVETIVDAIRKLRR